MDELMKQLSGYLDAAAGVVAEYAPQAVDAALTVVRVDAVFHIASSILFIACLVWLIRFVWFGAKEAKKLDDEKDYDRAIMYGARSSIAGFVALIAFVVGAASGRLFAVLDVYYWVAALDPTLGLVYKAAQSAGLL